MRIDTIWKVSQPQHTRANYPVTLTLTFILKFVKLGLCIVGDPRPIAPRLSDAAQAEKKAVGFRRWGFVVAGAFVFSRNILFLIKQYCIQCNPKQLSFQGILQVLGSHYLLHLIEIIVIFTFSLFHVALWNI